MQHNVICVVCLSYVKDEKRNTEVKNLCVSF